METSSTSSARRMARTGSFKGFETLVNVVDAPPDADTFNRLSKRSSESSLRGLTLSRQNSMSKSQHSIHTLIVPSSSMKSVGSWSSSNPLFDPSEYVDPDVGEFTQLAERGELARRTRGDTAGSLTKLRSVSEDFYETGGGGGEDTASETITPRNSNLRSSMDGGGMRRGSRTASLDTFVTAISEEIITPAPPPTKPRQTAGPSLVEAPTPSDVFQQVNGYSLDQPRYIPSCDSTNSKDDSVWATSQIWTNMTDEERIKHMKSRRLKSTGKKSSWTLIVEEQKTNVKTFFSRIVSLLAQIPLPSFPRSSDTANHHADVGTSNTTTNNSQLAAVNIPEHTCRLGQVDSTCVVCARTYVPKVVLELEHMRLETSNHVVAVGGSAVE